MSVCRNFQLLQMSPSWGMVTFAPPFWEMVTSRTLMWLSWRIEGSLFHRTTFVINHKTLPSTVYNSKKTVKYDDVAEQASYGPDSSLYGQAHIDVESETPGESIYADFTIVFSWGCRPQIVFLVPICPLSDYAISWEIAISKNLDFHQKPIFWRVVGTKRNDVEAWNF
jgi:hypothetical protein